VTQKREDWGGTGERPKLMQCKIPHRKVNQQLLKKIIFNPERKEKKASM
jgi:hypothetical protein